ncbi:MAG: hypothetical protein ACRC9G_08025 [Aeromonas veronii]
MPLVTLKWDDDNSDLTGFEVRGSTQVQWFQDMAVKATLDPTVKEYSEDRHTNEPYFLQVAAQRNGQNMVSEQTALTYPAQVMTTPDLAVATKTVRGTHLASGRLGAGSHRENNGGPSMTDKCLVTRDGKFLVITNNEVRHFQMSVDEYTVISNEPLPGTVRWAGLDNRGTIYLLIQGTPYTLHKFNPTTGLCTLVFTFPASETWSNAMVSPHSGQTGALVLFGSDLVGGKMPIGVLDLTSAHYQVVVSPAVDPSVTNAYGGWVGHGVDNNLGDVMIYWPRSSNYAVKFAVRDMAATLHDMQEGFPINSLDPRNGVLHMADDNTLSFKFIGGGTIYTLNVATMALGKAPVNETLNDTAEGSGFVTFADSNVVANYLPSGDYIFMGAGAASALVVLSDFSGGYTIKIGTGGMGHLVVNEGVVRAYSGSRCWEMAWGLAPSMAVPDSYYAGCSVRANGVAVN